MADPLSAEEQEDLEEFRHAKAMRRERDLAMTMSERLEALHRLCAQLARLEPVRPKPPR